MGEEQSHFPENQKASWCSKSNMDSGVYRGRLESQEHPLPVTLNELFNLYMPQFPHSHVGRMALIDRAGMKVE